MRTSALDRGGNPHVALDGSWEDYFIARSRSLKKAVNLASNRLHKAGDVRIEWATSEACDETRFECVLDSAIDVSRRSWKASTGNALDQPGPQAFIRALSRAAYRRGWASIWLIRVDERALAMEYQLIHDGNVHALRADFDAGCADISPGSHLSRHLLERLFGRGWHRYYLGPGDNPYKRRWTVDEEPLKRVIVYNRTWRGRRAWWFEEWVKPRLRAFRARLLGRGGAIPARHRKHRLSTKWSHDGHRRPARFGSCRGAAQVVGYSASMRNRGTLRERAMNGVLGWVGMHVEDASTLLAAMAGNRSVDEQSFASHLGTGFAVAATGPAGSVGVLARHGWVAAWHGHMSWRPRGSRHVPMAEVAAHLLDAFLQRGDEAFAMLRGDYAVALIDPAASRAVLAVDRMGVRNISYCEERSGIVFGPSCDALSRHPDVRRDVEPQALYDYVYFHMVPGPTTVYRRQRRLLPGHLVDAARGRTLCARTGAALQRGRASIEASLKPELRRARAAVRDLAADATCGAFLSGGTDSSTVAGMLGEVYAASRRDLTRSDSMPRATTRWSTRASPRATSAPSTTSTT